MYTFGRESTAATMKTPHTLHMRAERLVGLGRITLAASSLFAVWLDPAEPARYSDIAYILLTAYLGYSALVALLVWRWEAASPWWRVASHAFDLGFFSLFVYFTEGPNSPFFAYFVFALVCGTLRWQRRGVLWTAVASLSAYGAAGIYFGEILEDPTFDLNSFIIRAVYFVVVAFLLGYLGTHELRVRHDMARLAAAPAPVSGDIESVVEEMIRYAAAVLRVPRVVLAWHDHGDGTDGDRQGPADRLNRAVWHSGTIAWGREVGGSADELVVDRLREAHFICGNVRAPLPIVRYGSAAAVEQWRGTPLPDDFVRRFDVRSVIALRVVGLRFYGRLFLFDKPGVTIDDLVLGEILAGVIAARLDNFYLTRELRNAAAIEERVRLARDLHDGTLQSFTGIALRLETARRMLRAGPSAPAAAALQELQQVIATEQRDLRFFIQELEPSATRGVGAADALAQKLGVLVDRMSREWDLKVDLHAEGVYDEVSDSLAHDVYHIVREALVNAARHGEASRVRVDIRADADGNLAITVADNGHGFPFQGSLSSEALADQHAGPRSLRERVAALAGSLHVRSGRAGATLDVVLPLGASR